MQDCVVCGAQGDWLYKDLRDVLFGIEGTFDIKRCPQCGLLWQDPVFKWEDALRFHNDLFEPDVKLRTNDKLKENFIVHLKQAVREGILCGYYGYRHLHRNHLFCFLGKFLGLMPFLRTKATWDYDGLLPRFKKGPCLVVDVGCGEGAYLQFMRMLGWDVFGVEPHPKAVAILRQKGIPVFAGQLQDAKIKDGSADLVTLKHVLEHVPYPGAVISECFRILKEGGRLVIHTPNAESLGRKMFGRHCYHLDQPRHMFVFSPKSLRLLFAKSRFRKFDLKTLATHARNTYNNSVAISRYGRLKKEDIKRQKGDLLFYARESLLVFLGRECGEEIEVVAVK